MPRMLYRLFVLLCLSTALSAQELTLEDIFLKHTYDTRVMDPSPWIENGQAFLKAKVSGNRTVILREELVTGEESIFINSSALQTSDSSVPISFDEFTISPDERWLLLLNGREQLWRRSSQGYYYLHDRQAALTRRLSDRDRPQSNPHFSPDSRKVAYVLENNLYIRDLKSGKTTQVTTDGGENIINGQADWLYEEEFSLTRAYEWSPDSRSIAFLRFDQGQVPTFPLVDEMGRYPTITTIRYPKVGERNSIVTLGVVDVRRNRTRWMNTGEHSGSYLPRISWTGRPREVAFYRLNRRQNRLELVFADARSGKSRVAATQTDSAWVDITDDLHFLGSGGRFLWTTETSGYRHIVLHDHDGHRIRPLTTGDWEVTEILAVDEQNRTVYFTGKKDGVTQQQVYRVRFDGTSLTRLTAPGGWNTVQLTPDFTHYILWRSNRNSPPQVSLHKTSGDRVRWFIEAAAPAIADLDLPPWEFLTITTSDGADLNAVILKPKHFDSRKRYPTLIYTYGGPGVQIVTDKWYNSRGRGLWHQYMAQEGFVILSVDNRGAAGRGKAFSNFVGGDLGQWAVHDQIEAAKWAARQPWGAKDRIGIWGWSFGGYTTLLALTIGADHFKAGAAVAPVTDWRLYDTAYTERYMGLLPENAAGYDAASVLNYAHLYRGGLLLVHGTGDDNVHPQHSWQLIDRLTLHRKPFDLMMYPGKNHNLPRVHYHLYSKLTAFLKENL